MTSHAVRLLFLAFLITTSGCGDTNSNNSAEEDSTPPVMTAEPSTEPEVLTARELRKRLRANERAKFERVGNDIVEAHLFDTGVKDISALKGLPLRFLDLGMCDVTDVSAIEGMPLSTLILENTKVSDLSAIKGMQLQVLQLQETPVTDLSMLKGMPIRELNLKNVAIDNLSMVANLPLQTLWVPGSKVTDISPLTGKNMVSLDIEGTAVANLAPLASMTSLRRLNIAQTAVSDLTPLKSLKLQRITLTPENITVGIEVIRDMPSLDQILTTMEGNPRQSSVEFWQKYDAGVWDSKEEKEEASADTPNADDNNKPAETKTEPAAASKTDDPPEPAKPNEKE